MKKPVVGVMPLWDDEKESLWMLPGYFDGIITNGGIPIMLPLTEDKGDLEQAAELCDGFLLTGGHDVSPEIYGEKPLDGKVSSNRKRDEMELYILRKALESDKPVLGICRGIQFIPGYSTAASVKSRASSKSALQYPCSCCIYQCGFTIA